MNKYLILFLRIERHLVQVLPVDTYFKERASCHSNKATITYISNRFHHFFHQRRSHLYGFTCFGNFHNEENLQKQTMDFVLRRRGLLKNGVN